MFECALAKRFFVACLVLVLALPCVTAFAEGELVPEETPLSASSEAAETSEPDETLSFTTEPGPDESPAPDEVPTPDETPTLDETFSPDEISVSDETPAPNEMSIPDETPTLDKTPTPDESPTPNETSVPTEIPAPIVLPSPTPHLFWTTSFEDYSVTEGLLLLIFSLFAIFMVIKVFLRR